MKRDLVNTCQKLKQEFTLMSAAFITSYSNTSHSHLDFQYFRASVASNFRTSSTIKMKVGKNFKLKPCAQHFEMDVVWLEEAH